MALYMYTSTARPRQLLRRGSDKAPSLVAFLADCPSSHAGGQGKAGYTFIRRQMVFQCLIRYD
jgi:hypothetical protein